MLNIKALGLDVVDGHRSIRRRVGLPVDRSAAAKCADFFDRISSPNYGDGLEASVGYVGGMVET